MTDSFVNNAITGLSDLPTIQAGFFLRFPPEESPHFTIRSASVDFLAKIGTIASFKFLAKSFLLSQDSKMTLLPTSGL